MRFMQIMRISKYRRMAIPSDDDNEFDFWHPRKPLPKEEIEEPLEYDDDDEEAEYEDYEEW